MRVPTISTRGPTGEVSPLLLRRIPIAIGIVVAGVLMMAGRLWYLQVVRGEEMRGLSEHNRIRLRQVPTLRGTISDRNGVVLAENRPSFDVHLVPEDAGDVKAVLARLGRYLGDGSLDEELSRQQKRRGPYQEVALRQDIAWSGVAAVETHQLELPGVTLVVTPRRLYPLGTLAAHVLGYVGEVTARDLEKRPSFQMGDVIGKAGIERPFDDDLRGIPGREQVEVDALGRRIRVLDAEPDVSGNNLTLTLDSELQAVAEQALEGYRGAVVALDPATGEVLVLASHPTFDPNEFATGISPRAWRQLTNDPYRPLTNRATQGQYPPGSTFKIVVGIAALEERVVRPDEDVCCPGSYVLGRRRYRCWRRQGHGCLSFEGALAQSCDVFFYEMGNRLGVDKIAKYARRFGLGNPVGLGIGYEERGLIPDSDWKRRRFGERWYPGETLSVAIGQGYVLVTPLQMASVVATVANGGTRYQPYLVKRIEGQQKTWSHGPQVLGTLGVRSTTMRIMRRALRDAVMGKRGTGARARVAGFEVAGKTGTAQAAGADTAQGGTRDAPESLRDHAWFVGYAPADRPTIAVAALVEHAGQHGGTVAAPIVRAVIERHLASM